MNKIIHRLMDNKRIVTRFIITMAILLIISRIVYFLFTKQLDKQVEAVLNVVIGALLASLHKIIEFWFHGDTEDSDHRRSDEAVKPPESQP